MSPLIDLHVHTSASDGRFSPEALMAMATQRGLSLIAIADHDTVAGIPAALQAARKFPELKLIAAVEISSQSPGSEVHVLGYFIDYTDAELIRQLAVLQESRQDRARAMVAKLQGLGLDIRLERVEELAGSGCIGRPHIAQALLEKGYVSSLQEVFNRYIGQGGPAYVERYKLTPEEAVALIVKSRGLPVLAHPSTINNAKRVIARLKAVGLVGLEVYYKDYTDEQRQELARLASKYNLVATGGSDYHGLDEVTEVMLGEARVPPEVADNLISLARQKGLRLTF